MSDRLAELLAKMRVGPLAAEEHDELIRLLNAPVMPAPGTQTNDFASKHTFAPSDVAARLLKIDWFAACGEALSLGLSMPIELVGSWPDAVDRCTDGVWENVELEASNQLTQWLHQHHRDSYQKWNELVVQHKAAIIEPLTAAKLVPYQQSRRLDGAVVDSVRWDVLGALMENSFLSTGHRCFFFLELLTLYESGHFPCGWSGDWPRGKLLFY
jgi:hypothetical protein